MNKYSQKILKVLSINEKGLNFSELVKKLKVKHKDIKALREALKKLENEGSIAYKKHKYIFNQKRLITAKIARLNKTFGFAYDEKEDKEYFIPGKFLMGALPDDKVLLRKIKGKGESDEAKVIKILSYGKGEFTGVLLKENNMYFILPDTLMKQAVTLKQNDTSCAKVGDKVLAKITYRGKSHFEHKARIITSYGEADSAMACAEAILDLNGISLNFPEEVIDRAKYLKHRDIKAKDLTDRLDLTDEIIFTIDSKESKDLDDAVSIKRSGSGYELSVHIADVSHYVHHKDVIDNEAFLRGTSIYYADKVIPMLPKELSNGICSLSPDCNRLTFSCFMKLDKNGVLEDFYFAKSVIRSKVKGVYKEINELFAGTADDEIKEKYKDVKESLFLMKELADILSENRKKRGSPDIQTPEGKFEIDKNGRCINVIKRGNGISENIIEEFMLLANESAATLAKQTEIPFVYRIHERPEQQKIDNLNVLLKALDPSAKTLSYNIKPKALAEVLEAYKGKAEFEVINTQVLRTMSKAKYSENPIGHYGLALENYAHFTSPIRRYPDLTIHRILSDYALGIPIEEINNKYRKFVVKSSSQSSQQELNAMMIERECEDCYKAEYMSSHIGESFEGIISSVAGHGIYVRLANTVEGLIRIEALPEGEYEFDGLFQLKQLNGKKAYRIGDKILVRCVKSDINSGNIDFEMLDETENLGV